MGAGYSPAQRDAMFYAVYRYRGAQDRLSYAERRGIYEEDRPVGFVGLMVLPGVERKRSKLSSPWASRRERSSKGL